VIANDVVEAIGKLAEEHRDSEIGDILIALGCAPDEVRRLSLVAAWSVERVERSLVAMAIDGLLGDDPGALRSIAQVPIASWLDGFAVGFSVGLDEADRRAR
jgi:hypothetical protein